MWVMEKTAYQSFIFGVRSLKNEKVEFFSINIVGSPYEMGYAHGDLMQQEVRGLMDGVWSYLEEKVVSIAANHLSHCVEL